MPHAPASARQPRITLVIPCFNAEAWLRDCILSVLSQEYPDLELILADGGSTDASLAIAQEYAHAFARIVSEPDNGMYDALARAFDQATGEIFGYLNTDDLLLPQALERVAAAFALHPDAAAVYFEDAVLHNGWLFPNARQPEDVDAALMLKPHTLFQDGVYFRAQAYRAAGGFDRSLRLAGDWDFFARLSLHGRFARMPGHISAFRIRDGQLSQNFQAYLDEQKVARERIRQGVRPAPARLPARVRNLLSQRLSRRWRSYAEWRLHFPYAYAGDWTGPNPEPRPQAAPSIFGQRALPRCPATGAPADQLLFSAPDARFGGNELYQVFLCRSSGIAVAWPPVDPDRLKTLYEANYSGAGTPLIPPADPARSPYRGYAKARRARALSLRPGWVRLRELLSRVRPAVHSRAAEQELLDVLGRTVSPRDPEIRFLDVGCFEGTLLDALARQTAWRTFGLEANATAAAKAREAGHEIWECFAEDAPALLPPDQRFDVIHLGQVIEHFQDPAAVLRALAPFLAPKGRVYLTTPNLDSWQITLFGPTWAHWHLPYHRHFLSARGLRALAQAAGLRVRLLRSASHVYWTAMSLQQREYGLAGSVCHTASMPPEINADADAVQAFSALFHDPWLRGDYLIACLERQP